MWIVSSSLSSLPPFDISSYVVELEDAREMDGHNLMGRGICRGWRGGEEERSVTRRIFRSPLCRTGGGTDGGRLARSVVQDRRDTQRYNLLFFKLGQETGEEEDAKVSAQYELLQPRGIDRQYGLLEKYFATTDMVVEAVFKEMALKRKIIAQCEEPTPP